MSNGYSDNDNLINDWRLLHITDVVGQRMLHQQHLAKFSAVNSRAELWPSNFVLCWHWTSDNVDAMKRAVDCSSAEMNDDNEYHNQWDTTPQ